MDDSARDHMGPGGEMDLNGCAPPADDRTVSAAEGADYPAPGSVTGNGTDSADVTARSDGAQRGEKIIKVLSRSLFCPPFVALYSPLSLPLLSLSVL